MGGLQVRRIYIRGRSYLPTSKKSLSWIVSTSESPHQDYHSPITNKEKCITCFTKSFNHGFNISLISLQVVFTPLSMNIIQCPYLQLAWVYTIHGVYKQKYERQRWETQIHLGQCWSTQLKVIQAYKYPFLQCRFIPRAYVSLVLQRALNLSQVNSGQCWSTQLQRTLSV